MQTLKETIADAEAFDGPVSGASMAGGRVRLRSASGVMVYLTAREVAVVRGICDGYSNAELAARLGIALNTVRSHLVQIYRKLDTNSRVRVALMTDAALRSSAS